MADNFDVINQLPPERKASIRTKLQSIWQSGQLNPDQSQKVFNAIHNLGGFDPDMLAAHAMQQSGITSQGPAPTGPMPNVVAPHLHTPVMLGQQGETTNPLDNPEARTVASSWMQGSDAPLMQEGAIDKDQALNQYLQYASDKNYEASGVFPLAHGITSMARSAVAPDGDKLKQFYAGGTEAISGAMTTMTPLLGSEFSAGRGLSTLGNIGVAIGAQEATSAGLEKMGASPEASEFYGSLSGLVPFANAAGLIRGGKVGIDAAGRKTSGRWTANPETGEPEVAKTQLQTGEPATAATAPISTAAIPRTRPLTDLQDLVKKGMQGDRSILAARPRTTDGSKITGDVPAPSPEAPISTPGELVGKEDLTQKAYDWEANGQEKPAGRIANEEPSYDYLAQTKEEREASRIAKQNESDSFPQAPKTPLRRSAPGEAATPEEMESLKRQRDQALEDGDTAAYDAASAIIDHENAKRVVSPKKLVSKGPGKFFSINDQNEIEYLGNKAPDNPSTTIARVDGQKVSHVAGDESATNSNSERLADIAQGRLYTPEERAQAAQVRTEEIVQAPVRATKLPQTISPTGEVESATPQNPSDFSGKGDPGAYKALTNLRDEISTSKRDLGIAQKNNNTELVKSINSRLPKLQKRAEMAMAEWTKSLSQEDAESLYRQIGNKVTDLDRKATNLSNWTVTDTLAKELRKRIPSLSPTKKEEVHNYLGDVRDSVDEVTGLRRLKYYNNSTKPLVEEAWNHLTKLIPELENSDPRKKLYSEIVDKKLPYVLEKGEKIRASLALSKLPEITHDNWKQHLGDNVVSLRDLTRKIRASRANEYDAAREQGDKAKVQSLHQQVARQAVNLIKDKVTELSSEGKAILKPLGKTASEPIARQATTDFLSGNRNLKTFTTTELQAMDTHLEKMKDLKSPKFDLGYSSVRQAVRSALRQELESRSGKLKLTPLSMTEGTAAHPDAPKLPSRTYLSEEWHRLAPEGARDYDNKVAKMYPPSKIRKEISRIAELAYKHPADSPQARMSLAKMDALHRRLDELGAPHESKTIEQISKHATGQTTNITDFAGKRAVMTLGTGAKISGTISHVWDTGVVELKGDNGKVYRQPKERIQIVTKEQEIQNLKDSITGPRTVPPKVVITPKGKIIESKSPDVVVKKASDLQKSPAPTTPTVDKQSPPHFSVGLNEFGSLTPARMAEEVNSFEKQLSTYTGPDKALMTKVLEVTKSKLYEKASKVDISPAEVDAMLTSPKGGSKPEVVIPSTPVEPEKPLKSGGGAAASAEKPQSSKEKMNAEASSKAKSEGYDPEQIARSVVAGGADFLAIEDQEEIKTYLPPDEAASHPDYRVYFNDPQTHSTLVLPIDQVTPDNIRAKIQASRAGFEQPKARAAAASASVSSFSDLGKIVRPAEPPPQAVEPPKTGFSPEAKEAAKSAIGLSKEIYELTKTTFGTDAINSRIKAFSVGAKEYKIFTWNKALEIYRDGLKADDPMALRKSLDYINSKDPNTGTGALRSSLFGLDSVSDWLTQTRKTQLPVASDKLRAILDEQQAEEVKPSFMQKMAAFPYATLKSLVDRFYDLNTNPSGLVARFAPPEIRTAKLELGLQGRTELPIKSDPYKQARLSMGGGGGIQQGLQIRFSQIKKEAMSAGLYDNLTAYLNAMGYDRAIRNVQGKAVDLAIRANTLKAEVKAIRDDVQAGKLHKRELSNAVRLNDQANNLRAESKALKTKLDKNAVVPMQFNRADILGEVNKMKDALGPEDFNKVETMAKSFWSLLRKGWDDMADAQIITVDQHEAGTKLGDNYIPLFRILDAIGDGKQEYVGGNTKLQLKVRKSLQYLEGSDLTNKDPWEASMQQLSNAYKEIEKAKVARSVVGLASELPGTFGPRKEAGQMQGIYRVGADYRPRADEGIISNWEDGKRQLYAAPALLANALNSATFHDATIIGGIATRAVAKVFRLGTTLANLSFAVPNAIRDVQDYAALSETGLRHPGDVAKLITGWLAASKEVFQENPDYLEMLENRAGFSTLQRAVSGMGEFESHKVTGPLANFATHPWRFNKVIKSIEDFNNVIEETTKLTAYKRGKDLYGSDEEGRQKAAWETRNYGGSPDFARNGFKSSAINQMWMFFNANIQGTARTIGRLAAQPDRLLSLLTMSTFMALSQNMHNSQYVRKDGTREIDHVSDTELQNYFVVLSDETYQTSTGEIRNRYYKFPKPHWARLFYNPIENSIKDFVSPKGMQFGKTALDIVSQALPGNFNLQSGKLIQTVVRGTASSMNPLLREGLEQAENYDNYRGIPIEERGMDNLENPYKYSSSTSSTAKALTKMIYDNTGQEHGLAAAPVVGAMLTSPKRLEHAVGGFLGGLGQGGLNMSDAVVDAVSGKANKAPSLEGDEAVAHAAVIGPIARRFVGSPVDQVEKELEENFYQAADSAQKFHGQFNHFVKTDPQAAKQYISDPRRRNFIQANETMVSLQNELANLRSMQKEVSDQSQLSDEQRKKAINAIHDQRILILQGYEKRLKPILDKTPQP